MLLPSVPQFRRRRGGAKRLAQSPPPPPPPPPAVMVTQVLKTDSFQATWYFSAAVTLVGASVPELEIDGEGLGFIGPDWVMQTGPGILLCDYSSASGIEVGDSWRILSPPPNLSPALLIPQSGFVVS